MEGIYSFVGASPHKIDRNRLSVPQAESDSHYNMKYPHRLRSAISQYESPKVVSDRIFSEIRSECKWFYEAFYPGPSNNE